jgi:hypothetical protein
MIKTPKIVISDSEEIQYLKKIRHIVSSLYRIKEINRKKDYDSEELKNIVLNHPIGKQVEAELIENKVTTNSKMMNEESSNKATSAYKKFMDIYNFVEAKGELNKYETGWDLGDVETYVFDGGMTRKISYGDFRAVMYYDDSIEYVDGNESNLDDILIYLEKI